MTVSPNDVEAIEQAILTYKSRFQAGEDFRISTAGIEDYDRKSLAKKLSETLNLLA